MGCASAKRACYADSCTCHALRSGAVEVWFIDKADCRMVAFSGVLQLQQDNLIVAGMEQWARNIEGDLWSLGGPVPVRGGMGHRALRHGVGHRQEDQIFVHPPQALAPTRTSQG